MKKSLFFFLLLLSAGAVTAQSASKDSLYYVHLRDGSTLYSRKVRLVDSSAPRCSGSAWEPL
jgi:hypothetical protein